MTGARMSKGEATRQRLLDAAQRSILEKGFTATSIDELIVECGLTKGGFFYHFKDKTDLAKALLNRYIAEDEEVYDRIFSQARDLVDDPLQVFLLGLKLLADVMGDMPNGHPGCMVAVSCYYERSVRPRAARDQYRGGAAMAASVRGTLDEIVARIARANLLTSTAADLVSTVPEAGSSWQRRCTIRFR